MRRQIDKMIIAVICFTVFFINLSMSQIFTYPIVGTGVTSCNNNTGTIACPASSSAAFYGQFPGVRVPSYQNNGNGTITDLNTGLMWQSNPEANGNNNGVMEKADKLTWAQIQAKILTINSSNYGGHNDWRIPTIKELYLMVHLFWQ